MCRKWMCPKDATSWISNANSVAPTRIFFRIKNQLMTEKSRLLISRRAPAGSRKVTVLYFQLSSPHMQGQVLTLKRFETVASSQYTATCATRHHQTQ
jgi:hypothetical protein